MRQLKWASLFITARSSSYQLDEGGKSVDRILFKQENSQPAYRTVRESVQEIQEIINFFLGKNENCGKDEIRYGMSQQMQMASPTG
mmetsp:Transcript_15481/g.42786  ORF Transcript_15481/g.42786 Transcript_15481/m.42786 type:complete len:86 (-) Transcript_15481:1733-1990(-)